MAGFPFAAIGAGLGQGAQAIQQQREAQIREQLARLAITQQQRQAQQQDQQQQALSGQFSTLMSGDSGVQGLSAFGGAPPQRDINPQMPPQGATARGRFGGMSVPSNFLETTAQYESDNRNIPQGVVPPGGGYNPSVGRVTGPSSAQGYFQITDSTWKDSAPAAGVNLAQYPNAMSAPRDVQKQVAEAVLKRQGPGAWTNYNPRLAAAVGIDLHPEVRQQVGQGVEQTAQTIPPDVYGKAALQALARKVDQANPGASPAVKMMILDGLQKLMAPGEQQRFQLWMEQHREQFQRETMGLQQQFQERQSDKTRQFERENKAPNLVQMEGGGVGALKPDLSVTPVPGVTGKVSATGGAKASNNIEVTDSAGKVTFSGAAHQTPQGWVADKDNKLIEAGDGDIKILGRGTQGRQAAAQIQSMIGASSELVGEAKNLMELPAVATAGIFQGIQGVPASGLGDAVKRSLANTITPEEAIDLKTSFQGVSRALATIEAQGRATGLVGLTAMSEQLMPQAGDTQGNKLRKLATLRQIMERNIDAIAASPNATREQKEFLKQIRGEMSEVIPFTVSDVNKLQHGDSESVAEAAKKFGLGAPSQQGATPSGVIRLDAEGNVIQ